MAYKVGAICFIVFLLLSFALTFSAGRPEPVFGDVTPMNTQYDQENGEAERSVPMEESCEGVGEEECLMRRTLTAQIDYIYTQKQKP